MESELDDFLEHYGVKGMKWGVRKDRNNPALAGVTPKVSREAAKDAKEHARAKMFFGDGAGTRRKLINSTVKSKSEKSASYKKAFDHHSGTQNMGKHVSKAKSERRRKDVREKTGKTARGVHRSLSGGMGNVTMASAAIAAAYVGAKATGTDKVIKDAAMKKFTEVKDNRGAKNEMNDWLRKNKFI